MPHKTFFEKFDQFADAPGAVAKMRELVLHLAVTGKLVPQDPKDESAENLCEPDDELTASSWFEIPHKWVWVRLTMLADINGGFAFKSSGYTDEGIRVIRISDFDEFGFKDHKVVRHPFTPDLHKFTLAQSNILMAMTGGTVGKSYLVRMLPEPMVVNQRVATIKVSDSVIPSYIDIVIRSEITQEAIRKAKNSTNDNISMGDIKGFAIPLPPLAEQKRIVAKVDELMALCDRLEAQQQERDQKQTALARASLARFADAPTPANLELLFYPSAPRLQLPAPRSQLPAPSSARPLHSPSSFLVSPADLRKSILTLAVQGKLVPQDPNDEPAEEFLLRTKARHALPRGSKARKTNGSMEIAADEIPFVIPESWAWCRLETIADKVTDGEHLSPVKTASGMPLLTATHVTAKGVTLNNPQYVSVKDGHKSRQRCDPTRGDILICSRGTIGRCAVVELDDVFCLMGSVILVRFPAESSPRYFNYFLSTDFAQTEMRGMSGATAVQALYLKDIRQSLIPIPPLAEQRRIVAKVDQLMALLDQLEVQLANSRTVAEKLLEALVSELTQ